MMLPVQSQGVTRNDAALTTRDLNQIFQPNAEQPARVVTSRQDPVSPTLFRVALEVGNQRLEVMTNRPLAEGLSVLISRDARGEVALRLPAPTSNPASPSPNQLQALNKLSTQANQFIAMIAPESRAQAQQLLSQSQMMGLVQPQIVTAPLITPSELARTRQEQSATNSAPSAKTTGVNTSTKTGGSNPSPAISNAAANAAPNSASQTGQANSQNTLAALSASANSLPVDALRGASTISAQSAQTGEANQSTERSPTANPINSTQTGRTAPGQATQPSVSNLPNGGTNAATPAVQTEAAALAANRAAALGSSQPAITPVSAQASTQTPSNIASGATNSGQTSGPKSANANTASTPVNQTTSGQTSAPIAANAPITTAAANSVLPSVQATNPPIANSQTGIQLARVVDAIDPRLGQPNLARTTVNLGSETLNLITPRPLLAGQQVEITRLSDTAVQVRILTPPPAKGLPQEVLEEMQALLRQAMPIQAPLADSLNQMRALNTGRSQDAVGQIVRSLMGLFSFAPQSKPEAQAKQVEQMMQQSGLFTENQLAKQANGQSGTIVDLRTRLGQLRRSAQELPTAVRDQLNALIDRAEARATHQQIQSARQWRDHPDGSAERYFRMDLPLQTPQGFKQVELELKEKRRPISPTQLETNWTLNLHFDLEPIGALDARVHLENEWQVSISFWAQSAQTTEIIRERLNEFSTHLGQQGFDVEAINVRRGRAPNNLAPILSKHLVDVHT